MRRLTLPLALATAKQIEFTGPLLEALGIREHFQVVCAPAMSALHERKAVTVARALRELGASRDAVVIGDTHYDIEAADACGVRVIGVTWGIGEREELRAAGADVLVEHPSELTALLDGG